MLFKKILIAVNDDEYAIKPIRLGFEMARTFGAQVGVIYAVDQRLTVGSMDSDIPVMDALDMLREEAARTLDELLEKYGGGSKAARFTPEGRPTMEILRTAGEWQADLIILGTHGRSGLLQLFTGSISAYVKQHSKVPVLIVPTLPESDL